MARLNVREIMDRINETFHFKDAEKLLVDEEFDALLTQLERRKILASLGGGQQQQQPGGGQQQIMQMAQQMLAKNGINPNSPMGQKAMQAAAQRAGQAGGGQQQRSGIFARR